MFETAELGRRVDKATYDEEVPELRFKLLQAQHALQRKGTFSTLILVGGVDGAGRGETVNRLLSWMDPRYVSGTAFGPPSDEERERPPFWRFWRPMPPLGETMIFFGSWYTAPILNRVFKEIDAGALDRAIQRINAFERALCDDGVLLLKFWFHLSKKAQRKRLKALEKDKKTRWRVSKQDWARFAKYDRFRRVCERVVRLTSTGWAPWTIVEGRDRRYRELTVGREILTQVERRLELEDPGAALARPAPAPSRRAKITILSRLDLTQTLERSTYRKELLALQGRLNLLCRTAGQRGTSTIMVFEGWDAAGKGGAIRRITAALDARWYRVIPIAAPTDEERARHYLWRFWRHLPRAGRVTIYDRSWYGRVLVERVEGLAAEHEWARSYHEINEFEEQLTEDGIALFKFWLHISPDEQLARFREREQTPWKQHKITPEDWRNREKWDDYEQAAEDMIERTSTEFAPWTLVASNDKNHARIKILRTLCERLERVIEK